MGAVRGQYGEVDSGMIREEVEEFILNLIRARREGEEEEEFSEGNADVCTPFPRELECCSHANSNVAHLVQSCTSSNATPLPQCNPEEQSQKHMLSVVHLCVQRVCVCVRACACA